jgi:hypothetical protein
MRINLIETISMSNYEDDGSSNSKFSIFFGIIYRNITSAVEIETEQRKLQYQIWDIYFENYYINLGNDD